jgi:hypothetical protein
MTQAGGVEVDALGAALWTLHDRAVVHLPMHQTTDAATRAVGLDP